MSHPASAISINTGFSRSQVVLRSIRNSARQVAGNNHLRHRTQPVECRPCRMGPDTLLLERYKPKERLIELAVMPEMRVIKEDAQPTVQFWKAGLEERMPYGPPALGESSVSTPSPPPEAGDGLVSLNYEYVTNAGTTLDVLA